MLATLKGMLPVHLQLWSGLLAVEWVTCNCGLWNVDNEMGPDSVGVCYKVGKVECIAAGQREIEVTL